MTAKNQGLVMTLLAVLLAVGLAYYFWRPSAVDTATAERDGGTFRLRFNAKVGNEPLALNTQRYANPVGAGHFIVQDFRFFISNINLIASDHTYSENDSYHLLRFDQPQGADIVLMGVSAQEYDFIELGIGIDMEANRSLQSRGDLDPNSRMAWNWEVGYKFVLFEGLFEQGNQTQPLVYHVGFDENYHRVRFALPAESLEGGAGSATIELDLLKLFDGKEKIDMAGLASIKFDRADARRFATNYAHFLTLAAQP